MTNWIQVTGLPGGRGFSDSIVALDSNGNLWECVRGEDGFWGQWERIEDPKGGAW